MEQLRACGYEPVGNGALSLPDEDLAWASEAAASDVPVGRGEKGVVWTGTGVPSSGNEVREVCAAVRGYDARANVGHMANVEG